MKQGKRLTRKEKEMLSAFRLNPGNWLKVKETKEYTEYRNKISNNVRRVQK